MGAAYLATDVALNPQKYTSKAIKDKASRETVKVAVRARGLLIGCCQRD